MQAETKAAPESEAIPNLCSPETELNATEDGIDSLKQAVERPVKMTPE
jgi:hypothetical protein